MQGYLTLKVEEEEHDGRELELLVEVEIVLGKSLRRIAMWKKRSRGRDMSCASGAKWEISRIYLKATAQSEFAPLLLTCFTNS